MLVIKILETLDNSEEMAAGILQTEVASSISTIKAKITHCLATSTHAVAETLHEDAPQPPPVSPGHHTALVTHLPKFDLHSYLETHSFGNHANCS